MCGRVICWNISMCFFFRFPTGIPRRWMPTLLSGHVGQSRKRELVGAHWSQCVLCPRERRERHFLLLFAPSSLPPSLSPCFPSFLPCFLPSVLPSLSSYRLIIPNVLEICTSAPLGESVSCNQLSQALWQKRKEVLSGWVCGAAPFWGPQVLRTVWWGTRRCWEAHVHLLPSEYHPGLLGS